MVASPPPLEPLDAVAQPPLLSADVLSSDDVIALEGTQSYKPTSEDCLFLNVVAPPLQHKNKTSQPPQPLFPVMVWIHGGNDLTGSGAESRYNGSSLVTLLKDMVVVTVNYRLGVLG